MLLRFRWRITWTFLHFKMIPNHHPMVFMLTLLSIRTIWCLTTSSSLHAMLILQVPPSPTIHIFISFNLTSMIWGDILTCLVTNCRMLPNYHLRPPILMTTNSHPLRPLWWVKELHLSWYYGALLTLRCALTLYRWYGTSVQYTWGI